jgi:dTDP-D-glucose 4,6-dehydratase
LHVSTDEVHGTVDDETCSTSSTTPYSILDPTNPYAATKAAAEMIVRSYGHSYKMPYLITRANNIYGPRQYPEKLIPTALMKWMRHEPFEIHGTGTSRRHFLYVKDAAEAFKTLAERFMADSTVTKQIVMISGASYEPTVMEVVESLRRHELLASLPKEILHVTDRPFNDVRYYSARDAFLWDRLGWEPKTDWEHGLTATIQYYMEKFS